MFEFIVQRCGYRRCGDPMCDDCYPGMAQLYAEHALATMAPKAPLECDVDTEADDGTQ